MGKNIWIINQYLTTPELNGNGYRHSYLAEIFEKKGYDVTLITSNFSHVPYKDYKIKGFFKILETTTRTVLVKGNRFKNSKGLSRILSWSIFCVLLFFIPKKKLPKPDYIIVSSMSILPVLNVVFYFKKKFTKAKFIFETRDIWPLTPIELGGYSERNPMIRFLAWTEKLGYKKADHNVSVLRNADKHMKNVLGHNSFKFTWISNGYHIDSKAPMVELSSDLDSKIPKDKFVIGYAGTLGKANAMEYMVEAMQGYDDDVCFLVLGSGNEKERLIAMNNSKNVIFLDRVAKAQVMPFLKRCDVLYTALNDAKIFDFGISPQKIFEYMFAGRPILMSGDFVDHPVTVANCGMVIPAEDSLGIRKAITHLKGQEREYLDELGSNGKEYLLKNFTYATLADKYIEEVLK